MKAVVAAFNQEKALVGALSVITNLRMELFAALVSMYHCLQIMTVKEAPVQGGGRGAAATGQRPKSVQQWSVVDVQKWLRRHCGDYYHLYAESFLEQEVGPCLC